MFDFHQKDTHATNFLKDKKELYENAMKIFISYNPKIKVWIEDTAFDFLGRPHVNHLSLHTNQGHKGKIKWIGFFSTVDKKKILSGEIKYKKTIKEKFKTFLNL